MGAFLYTGIVTKVEVESLDTMGRYKFLPLELYDIEEGERRTTLTIKESVLSKENFKEFMNEQSKSVSLNNLDSLFEHIESFDSVTEALEDCYEYDAYMVKDIWAGMRICMLCYIRDGKFLMETYDNTLNYCIEAIRKSSDNPLIKTVDFIIV